MIRRTFAIGCSNRVDAACSKNLPETHDAKGVNFTAKPVPA